jgi:hypothetical protein
MSLTVLARNYSAIADRTVQVKPSKSVRRSRNWSWNRAHAKPGACVKLNPQAYDKGNTQC